MKRRTATGLLAAALGTLPLAGACSALLAEPTPVPGAAATAARAFSTAIPTPQRAPGAVVSPGPSPVPGRSPAAAAAPSPARAPLEISDAEVNDLRARLERAVASPDLPGIDALLADSVATSTPEGGDVLSREAAVAWLKERAAPGIRVTRVDRNALAVQLQAETEGWQAKPAGTQGRVTFSMHRFDPGGRQDQERGSWRIDVATAE